MESYHFLSTYHFKSQTKIYLNIPWYVTVFITSPFHHKCPLSLHVFSANLNNINSLIKNSFEKQTDSPAAVLVQDNREILD